MVLSCVTGYLFTQISVVADEHAKQSCLTRSVSKVKETYSANWFYFTHLLSYICYRFRVHESRIGMVLIKYSYKNTTIHINSQTKCCYLAEMSTLI